MKKVSLVYIAKDGCAYEGAASQKTIDAWLRHPWDASAPAFWIATPWGFWPLTVLQALGRKHSFTGVRQP